MRLNFQNTFTSNKPIDCQRPIHTICRTMSRKTVSIDHFLQSSLYTFFSVSISFFFFCCRLFLFFSSCLFVFIAHFYFAVKHITAQVTAKKQCKIGAFVTVYCFQTKASQSMSDSCYSMLVCVCAFVCKCEQRQQNYAS